MRKTLGNLRTLLRTSFSTASVKAVVIGKNDEPLRSDLPQVQLFPINTNVELSGTRKDNQARSVGIRGIVSVPQNLSQTALTQETMSSILEVADLFEKKDTDGSINTASILGVLRHTPTINGQALFVNDMSVDYGSLDELGYPNSTANMTCTFNSRNLTK